MCLTVAFEVCKWHRIPWGWNYKRSQATWHGYWTSAIYTLKCWVISSVPELCRFNSNFLPSLIFIIYKHLWHAVPCWSFMHNTSLTLIFSLVVGEWLGHQEVTSHYLFPPQLVDLSLWLLILFIHFIGYFIYLHFKCCPPSWSLLCNSPTPSSLLFVSKKVHFHPSTLCSLL